MAHAFLPPSGASSWSKCAMWPTMNRQFPHREKSEAAEEGTAAHWVAEMLLANTPVTVGSVTPNGITVTDEMVEGAELLADTIDARTHGWPLKIEQYVPIPFIDSETFGKPDVYAIAPGNFGIEIIDYKFGFKFVDEYFNLQGLLYALGILNSINVGWNTWEKLNIAFTIVQPRCYGHGNPVRTHEYVLQEAVPYWRKLQAAAEAAKSPNPTATTGSHCGYCPGRHACSALQIAAYNDAEYSNQRTPLELSPAAAALELKLLMSALARLEARVDGLKELTIANIRAGKQVPYFRAEPGYGRQTWTLPEQQIIAMGQMFGKDLSKPGVVTPKQAEKAGVDPAVIKAYSQIPSTGFKLVAENPTAAARTFGRVPTKE